MTVVPNPTPPTQPNANAPNALKPTPSNPSSAASTNEPPRLFVGVLAYVLRRVWMMLQQSLRQDALPSLNELNDTGHRWSYEYFFDIVQCMSCFEKASRCVSDYNCDI
jgi:hypothetical protein